MQPGLRLLHGLRTPTVVAVGGRPWLLMFVRGVGERMSATSNAKTTGETPKERLFLGLFNVGFGVLVLSTNPAGYLLTDSAAVVAVIYGVYAVITAIYAP